MKQKHLESCLSSIPNRVFPDPKIQLEQYPTSVTLAASIVLTALAKGDAGKGRTVLDLGCGTGNLGLAFAMVKSDFVYLVDCDSDALDLARENVEMLEEEELIGSGSEDEDGCCMGVELIQAKLKYDPPKKRNEGGGGGRGGKGRGRGRGGGGGGRGRGGRGSAPSTQNSNELLLLDPNNIDNQDDGIPLPSKMVDTVITNPPFGTKNNEGIDVQFLKTAIRLARKSVYSFHKTSTRPFLVKLLRDKWGLNVEVVAEMKFDIPNMYKFHKQKCVDVEVDLIRVFWEEDTTTKDKDAESEEEESEGEEMPLGVCGVA
jgi:predicted RNA methylase